MGYCSKIDESKLKSTDNNSDSFQSNQHPLLSINTDLFWSRKHAYNNNVYSTDVDSTGRNNHDKYSADAGNTEHDYISTFGSYLSTVDNDSEKSAILSTKKIRTMAVTKLQVKLNNLINKNETSLGMYDDICHLFNDYISSGEFDPYAKFKKRTPFLRSIELMCVFLSSGYKLSYCKARDTNL
jgi:hypothetical protein